MKSIIYLSMATLLLSACGKNEDTMAKKVGDSVGSAVTDFTAGLGKGVDKSMQAQVQVSDGMAKKGVTSTTSKLDNLAEKTLTVYLVSTQAYKGKVMARASNKSGQEIGRSIVDVELGASDAKYIKFPFDPEMDMQLADKFSVEEGK